MYCGSRRIAAMISAQVSSAGATGEPTPSATAMPSRVQASTSMCGPTRPVCEISFSFGSFSSSWRGNWVRSRISTSTSASRSAHRELADALDGVGEDLGVEVLEDRCALELAHRVLVVVEDDDVHGAGRARGSRAPRRARPERAHCARPAARRVASPFHCARRLRWLSTCIRRACRSSSACSATGDLARQGGGACGGAEVRSVGLPAARLAPDMLPFTTADPDRLRRRQVLRRAAGRRRRRRSSPTTRRRLADLRARVRKTIDYVQSVPAAQIDGSDAKEISVPRRAGPMTLTGEAYLKHFVLPNFFFHVTTTYALLRHNGVELGKMRLPRRAAAGRSGCRLRSALAALPRPGRACRGAPSRARLAKCRSRSASRPFGLGLVVQGATMCAKTSSRRCQSSCSERATATRSRRRAGRGGADIARARRRSRGGPRRCAATRPRAPKADGISTPATRQPLAPSHSPSRDDQSRGANSCGGCAATTRAGAAGTSRRPGPLTSERRSADMGGDGWAGEARPGHCSVSPRAAKAANSSGRGGSVRRRGGRRHAPADPLRPRRTSPSARPCTSTTAPPAAPRMKSVAAMKVSRTHGSWRWPVAAHSS